MFGQQTNTPFGSGGGFGQQQQQQTNTAPAFGSPAPAAGGLFGSPPTAPFGAPPPAPFGGASTFGAPAAPTAFGQPAAAPAGGGIFGQPPAPAPGGFGAAAPTAPFGAPAPTPGLFGAAPTTSAFGAPGAFGAPAPAPGGGLFGGGTTPAPAPFGTSGGFGATAAAPAFGTSNAPFGATATTPGGGGLFGAQTPAPGGFGAPAASGFGAPAPSGFGAAPAPPTGGGLFGSATPGTSAFGAATTQQPGAFGSPPAAQQQGGGTRGTPFQATSKYDGTNSIVLQSISAMQPYEQKSSEELRFEDYSQGNKGSATPTGGTPTAAPGGLFPGAPAPTGGGLFGTAPAAPTTAFGQSAPAPGGSLFGSPSAAPATTFGGTTGFGTTPAPAATFGAPAPAPGGLFGSATPAPPATFGAPAAGGLFGGAPTPAPGGFGATTTSFGAPAPSAFATAPAPFGAAAPSSGGIFGSTPAPAPFGASAPAGGLFGSTTSPAPFGATAPAPGGLFQQPAPSATFGAPASGGNVFGQQTAAPTSFSFAGATAGRPLFGAPAPATFGAPGAAMAPFAAPAPGQFLGQTAAVLPSTPQNGVIVTQSNTEVLAQGLRALEQKQTELAQAEAWQRGGTRNATTTPTSVSESQALGIASDPRSPYAIGAFASPPQSSAKMRPRGFGLPKTEPAKKPEALLSSMGRGVGRGTSSSLTPDTSSRMHLVVKPDSLSKVRFTLTSSTSPGARVEGESPGLPSEFISPPPRDTPDAARASEPATPASEPSPHSGTPRSTSSDQASSTPESYYKKTISSSAGESPSFTPPGARDNTPLREEATPSALIPKLTKAEYECDPSIAELATMSNEDLATVHRFSVSRPGYGSVQWEGDIDVRGVDLDSAVVINQRDVSVYMKEEAMGAKPARGTKLNRPAVIEFQDIYPNNDPNASQEERDEFHLRLQRKSAQMGAEFLEYNQTRGIWRIRVFHFSRYALVDDEEEAESSPRLEHTTVRFQEDHVSPRPSSILRRKGTPYKSSRFVFDSSEGSAIGEADDMQVDQLGEPMTEAEIVRKVASTAETAYAAVFAAVQEYDDANKSFETAPSAAHEIVSVEDEFDDDEEESVGEALESILPPSEEDLLLARRQSGICGQLVQQRPAVGHSGVDSSLRLGKFFGVAWSPDGSFLSRRNGFPTELHKAHPVFNDGSREDSDDLITIQWACSEKVYVEGEEGSLYSLPRAMQNSGSERSHSALYECLKQFAAVNVGNKDAQDAFHLCAYLLESPDSAGSDGGFAFAERQKAAVLRWLVSVCADGRSVSMAVQRGNYALAAFAALSGGDVETACRVAADGGLFDLAAVLSTSVSDIARLLERLAKTRKASTLPPGLLQSLKDICPEVPFEDDLFRKDVVGFLDNWLHRLALRLLQEPADDLSHVIRRYGEDVESGAAPFPVPSYMKSAASEEKVESLLYRILCAVTSPGSMSESQVVSNDGFTLSSHDFCLPFHLSSGLAAMGLISGNPEEVERRSTDYEAQLVAEGRYHHAVLVCLCVPGPDHSVSDDLKRRKLRRAKNLILTHYVENDPDYRRDFLEGKLNIPSQWFSEALAGRAVSVVDYVVNELDVSTEKAIRVLENRYLPHIFFMSPSESESLMKTIETMAVDSDSLPAAIYKLCYLDRRIRDLDAKTVDAALVSELKDVHESIETILLIRQEDERSNSAVTGADSTRSLVVPEFSNRTRTVKLESMLSEALAHLGYLGLQLESLASSCYETGSEAMQ